MGIWGMNEDENDGSGESGGQEGLKRKDEVIFEHQLWPMVVLDAKSKKKILLKKENPSNRKKS